MAMKIRLKLFGALRDEAGGERALDLSLDEGCSVADLRILLGERWPAVARYGERVAVSVNLEVAAPDVVLSDGDEVALLPPVAGGSDAPEISAASARRCTISEAPLDEAEVVARVAGDDTGGVVSFVGTVRNQARGHEIEHLEYEAYPEMAEREMQKIVDAAEARWPGTRLALAHRIGHLKIGDAAVVVVAVSPHRGEAFEACRFAIDTLKVTVPIWKREVATDGAYWVDDHA
jgi:molybdopterin synthase catalytic subunit/molybdopterin converting factor small subunit